MCTSMYSVCELYYSHCCVFHGYATTDHLIVQREHRAMLFVCHVHHAIKPFPQCLHLLRQMENFQAGWNEIAAVLEEVVLMR